MIPQTQIQAFAEQIAERYSPEKIILFGSHARGQAYEGSDVDMLVVLDHETQNVEKAIEMLNLFHPLFPIDLLVRRPNDITKRLAMGDFFIKEILNQGVVLYDGSR